MNLGGDLEVGRLVLIGTTSLWLFLLGTCISCQSDSLGAPWRVESDTSDNDAEVIDTAEVAQSPDTHDIQYEVDTASDTSDETKNCSGPWSPTALENDSVFRRVSDNDKSGTYYLCPDELRPDTEREFSCVGERRGKPTKQTYLCEYESGDYGHMTARCREATDCSYELEIQCDRLGGDSDPSVKNCWDPPEQYCSTPIDTFTWFCNSDGSRCCQAASDCFQCGWIRVRSSTQCFTAVGKEKSENFCRNLWRKLDTSYQNCIRDGCSREDRNKIGDQPFCARLGPHSTLKFCTDN